MWKLRELTLHTFWQKFRESNVFTKGITNEMFDEKIFQPEEKFHSFTLVRDNSRIFYTVVHSVEKREILSHRKKYSVKSTL